MRSVTYDRQEKQSKEESQFYKLLNESEEPEQVQLLQKSEMIATKSELANLA